MSISEIGSAMFETEELMDAFLSNLTPGSTVMIKEDVGKFVGVPVRILPNTLMRVLMVQRPFIGTVTINYGNISQHLDEEGDLKWNVNDKNRLYI